MSSPQRKKKVRAVVDGNVSDIRNPDPEVFTLDCMVKADRKVWQAAAAGIIAKEGRDRHMRSLAETVDPRFRDIFFKGKGYRWKPIHDELVNKGVFTKYHRMSFNPMKKHVPKES